ncbi:hypothetical protein ACFQZ4_14055 [Catellatospora coxensis]
MLNWASCWTMSLSAVITMRMCSPRWWSRASCRVSASCRRLTRCWLDSATAPASMSTTPIAVAAITLASTLVSSLTPAGRPDDEICSQYQDQSEADDREPERPALDFDNHLSSLPGPLGVRAYAPNERILSVPPATALR